MIRIRSGYLIAAFCLLSQAAMSQDEYKKFMISGQFAFNSISVSTPGTSRGYKSDTRALGITPAAGYFFCQNFAAGLGISFDYKKTHPDEITTNTLRSVSFVPFMRYYFLNGKIRPYFQAGAGGGTARSSSKTGNSPANYQKSTISIYEIKGGVELLINKNIGFDADFGYNSTAYYYGETTKWKNTSKGPTGSVALIIYL